MPALNQVKHMKYNTVIFDLDGTLINTLEDLTDSVNFAMREYGFPERTVEEVNRFVGNGVARLVNLSLPENTSEEIRGKCLAAFKKHYTAHSMDKTAPYPGIKQAVSELKNAGVRLAVVTNKMQEAATDIVRGFFGDTIDIVIGQVDSLPQKPAPDGVWRAIDMLGSARSESVYIGDSEVDCATAKNANLPVIGVTWGFRDRKVLEENKADYIIDDPGEILNIIK